MYFMNNYFNPMDMYDSNLISYSTNNNNNNNTNNQANTNQIISSNNNPNKVNNLKNGQQQNPPTTTTTTMTMKTPTATTTTTTITTAPLLNSPSTTKNPNFFQQQQQFYDSSSLSSHNNNSMTTTATNNTTAATNLSNQSSTNMYYSTGHYAAAYQTNHQPTTNYDHHHIYHQAYHHQQQPPPPNLLPHHHHQQQQHYATLYNISQFPYIQQQQQQSVRPNENLFIMNNGSNGCYSAFNKSSADLKCQKKQQDCNPCQTYMSKKKVFLQSTSNMLQQQQQQYENHQYNYNMITEPNNYDDLDDVKFINSTIMGGGGTMPKKTSVTKMKTGSRSSRASKLKSSESTKTYRMPTTRSKSSNSIHDQQPVQLKSKPKPTSKTNESFVSKKASSCAAPKRVSKSKVDHKSRSPTTRQKSLVVRSETLKVTSSTNTNTMGISNFSDDELSSRKATTTSIKKAKDIPLIIEKESSIPIQTSTINPTQQTAPPPPPPPPLPIDGDFFKSTKYTTINTNPEMLFRTKLRKSIPTDEETTKSFDAVVNELKSKFTKIKFNLKKSFDSNDQPVVMSPPPSLPPYNNNKVIQAYENTSVEHPKSFVITNSGNKSSNAIGIYETIVESLPKNNEKISTQSFSNLKMVNQGKNN